MFQDLARGADYLRRGADLVRRDRRLVRLGVTPAVVVLVVVVALLVLLLLQVGDLVAWATPFADGWGAGRTLVRLLLGVVVVVAALMLAVTTYSGLTLLVGDPFYERIWRATEEHLGGPVPEGELGFWRSARDALRLMALGLVSSVVLFVVGLLPVVGTAVALVLGVVVPGRLLAAELVARPLEARGIDRAAGRELLRRGRWRVLGFGVVTQLWFLWPVGAVTGMPGAVAGATILARDLLEEQR